MKTVTGFMLTAALGAAVLLAQSEGDYENWMKSAAATAGSIQKNIAAKDGAAVMADATKLQQTFKEVQSFWEMRHTPDAVNFAKQVQSGAEAVSQAAGAGDMSRAAAEAKTMMAGCGGCHMVHREKTESGFKIK